MLWLILPLKIISQKPASDFIFGVQLRIGNDLNVQTFVDVMLGDENMPIRNFI